MREHILAKAGRMTASPPESVWQAWQGGILPRRKTAPALADFPGETVQRAIQRKIMICFLRFQRHPGKAGYIGNK
jgi:hypothetical protein